MTLNRVGPSFATKWLWAAALAESDEKLRPVVVDDQLWGTLNRGLGWTGERAAAPRRGRVYRIAAAIRAINRWAPLLEHRWRQPVTPDAMEHLLFLRGAGSLHERLASDPL